MPARNRAHYGVHYRRQAAEVVAAAYANPDTRCRRCGLTLGQHEPHRNGTPATWDAGHIIDGQIDGQLAPEASTCNRKAGAILGNTRRARPTTTRTW